MAEERTASPEENKAVWEVLTDGEPDAIDRAQELAKEILEEPLSQDNG